MGEDEKKENWLYFSGKVKKHWIFALIVISSCIIAFIFGFVFIQNMIVDTIVGSLGFDYIQKFSTGSLLGATIWIMLMYCAVIALPTFGFLGALSAFYWYKIIPEEEKTELKEKIKSREKKDRKLRESRSAQAGGFGGIVGLAMIVKIAVDGNWLVSFENLLVTYFLEVWVTACFWLAIIFGIPFLIFFVVAVLYKKK